MIFPILALIGRILLLGCERILFKQAGEDEDPVVSTFWLFGLAAILQIPILLFFPFTLAEFSYAALAAGIYTVSFIIYVYVLSNYEISLVTPFYNFNVLFLLLLSIIFLDGRKSIKYANRSNRMFQLESGILSCRR